MMEFIRQWLIGILAAALILSLFYAMLPAGKFRSLGKLAGSLILLLVVLRPLVQLHPDWDFPYEGYAARIQSEIDRLQEENQNETGRIIAQQIAAYIADKGYQLGVTCHPRVSMGLRDGVPYPEGVTMDIPFHSELAEEIADELDIPRERQVWQER